MARSLSITPPFKRFLFLPTTYCPPQPTVLPPNIHIKPTILRIRRFLTRRSRSRHRRNRLRRRRRQRRLGLDPRLHILDFLGVVVVVNAAGAVVQGLAFRPYRVVGDLREVLFGSG